MRGAFRVLFVSSFRGTVLVGVSPAGAASEERSDDEAGAAGTIEVRIALHLVLHYAGVTSAELLAAIGTLDDVPRAAGGP